MNDSRRVSPIDAARLLLGFLVLPPLDAVLAFLLHRVIWPTGPVGTSKWVDPVQAATAFAAGVAIVAWIVTVAVAWPIVAWLLYGRRLSLKQIVVASLAFGNAPYAIGIAGVVLFYLIGLGTSADVGYVLIHGPAGSFRGVVIGSIIGVTSGFLFWAVAVRGTAYERRGFDAESGPVSTSG
jgi:hypothetical protein